MAEPSWYLLYGGHSEDGRGPGKYVGRTLFRQEALDHAAKCAADPYSTGYAVEVTDTTERQLPRESR